MLIMKNNRNLSVIIPAFNEEKNISDTVKSIIKILPKYSQNYEIIIINDGSNDSTGEIAEKLKKDNQRIKVLHNTSNKGMGYTYWRGVDHAKYNFMMLIWGDNAHSDQSLHQILKRLGKVDVVIPNYTNLETRTAQRRYLSKTFTAVINFITGLSIKYYNGSTLYRTDLVKNVPRRSTGFGYQAEVLAYVLKNGATFVQVDTLRRNVPDGPTAAFKIKNIINVFKSLLWLVWKLRILRSLDNINNHNIKNLQIK